MISRPADHGWWRLAAALLLAPALAGGSAAAAPTAPAAPSALVVFVTIPPQGYLVREIAGPLARVEVLVGPGQSAETYEPTPRQMAALDNAAVFFRIGVPCERALLPKIARLHPGLPIVDVRAGIRLRPWEGDDGHGHDEGDPHIWLDPELARIQARTMAATLARLDPAHAADYAAGLARLETELTAAAAEMARLLAPWRGRTFYVFHPAFAYLGAPYGLRQVAVQRGGREPTARQLAALIDQARREGVRTIFIQPQYAPRSARTVAEAIGAQLVPLDDLAPDYPANLRRLAAALAQAFAAAPAPARERP
ncbi:MAG: metal ABC transporter solute-binding protein, Zn/Mn family [Candidatus Krumholzibacteriia bacterium]